MKQNNKRFLKKTIVKFFIFHFSFFVLVGCGYKPSSYYIQNMFEDKIYVAVEIDTIEPENAPFVKDEINKLIYTRFHGHVVKNQADASNYIKVNYQGSSFQPIAYRDGYVTRYRANIRVRFSMKTKDGIVTRSISARHEDDIRASSLASSTLRTEAIRKGLAKALDQFIAYTSAKGVMIAHKKKIDDQNVSTDIQH